MPSKPWPVLLAVTAVIVALALDATSQFVRSREIQIATYAIRHTILWIIGCFIAMRYGSTDWTTRAVPSGLAVLLVAVHGVATYFASSSIKNAAQSFAINSAADTLNIETTSLILAISTTLVFSRLLNVSLRRVDCHAALAPLRFSLQTIFLITTFMAVFITLYKWFATRLLIPSQSLNLALFLLQAICITAAVFGCIWFTVSTRRRWLGIAGLICWPFPLIISLYMIHNTSVFRASLPHIVTHLTASSLALLVGVILTIPILRLFGYQFRIGNQQELRVDVQPEL